MEYIENKDISGIQVAVVIGSESDKEYIERSGMLKVFEEIGITYIVSVLSAHRHLEGCGGSISGYCNRISGLNPGLIFISAAGMSAALPGVIAAIAKGSVVIGVALSVGPLGGQDALYSMISMPKGNPVAVTGIGEPELYNAALLACKIIARGNKEISETLARFLEKKDNEKPSKWILATNKRGD